MSQSTPLVKGIYPILDAQWLEGAGPFGPWTDKARALVALDIAAANLPVLQLRCKGDGRAAHDFMEPWIIQLRKSAPSTALIINDRVDLALYFEADGVHMGQEDLPIHLCRRLLGPNRIIGLSTHSPQEIRHAAEETSANYLGFGPLFPTRSKQDTQSVQGIEALAEASRISPLPLVAIGGIGLAQLATVKATQVASAAMISGLWSTKGEPQFVLAESLWQKG
ncbi:MAG: thiamine phosphate synthase [Magnetococcales bacterium]|nr:thiamine phosphate synthase [Magnetococcales bacterium]